MDHFLVEQQDVFATVFEAWLRAQAPDAVVGRVRSCVGCPLAVWLTQTTERQWLVEDEVCEPVGFSKACPLPTWARAFVAAVDRLPGVSVTAAKALAVLAQVALSLEGRKA